MWRMLLYCCPACALATIVSPGRTVPDPSSQRMSLTEVLRSAYETVNRNQGDAVFATLLMVSTVARLRYDKKGTLEDVTMLALLGLWKYWSDIVPAMLELLTAYNATFFAVAGSVVLFFVVQSLRASTALAESMGISKEDLLSTPVFIPSRTNHARINPAKHSFSYSYLFVGIPVGWKGSIGSLLSVDCQARIPDKNTNQLISPKARTTWFSVEAERYLSWDKVNIGLRAKLEAYLKSQVRLAARSQRDMTNPSRVLIRSSFPTPILSLLPSFWAIPLIPCPSGICTTTTNA